MKKKGVYDFSTSFDMGMFLAERPHLTDEEKIKALSEKWPGLPESVYHTYASMGDHPDIVNMRRDEVAQRRAGIKPLPKKE